MLRGTVIAAVAASTIIGYRGDNLRAETLAGGLAEFADPGAPESEPPATNILRPGKAAQDVTPAAPAQPEPVVNGDVAEVESDASSEPKLRIVEAHELAARATTESQYTRIISLCAEGAIAPLDEEIATYAHAPCGMGLQPAGGGSG